MLSELGEIAAEEVASVPTLTVDGARMPNIAENIQTVQDSGLPSILNRETDQGSSKQIGPGLVRAFADQEVLTSALSRQQFSADQERKFLGFL